MKKRYILIAIPIVFLILSVLACDDGTSSSGGYVTLTPTNSQSPVGAVATEPPKATEVFTPTPTAIPTPTPSHEDWAMWVRKHEPRAPRVNLELVCTTCSTNDVFVRVSSKEDIAVYLYVDSAELGRSTESLTGTFRIPEGSHTVTAVATDEVCPEDVGLVQYGCAKSSGIVTSTVLIDTTGPYPVGAITVSPEGGKGRLIVSGTLSDGDGVGPKSVECWQGNKEVGVRPNGYFEFTLTYEEDLAWDQDIHMTFLDSLGNRTEHSEPIVLDPNRWVRYRPDGRIVDVVMTPHFDPFSVGCVGLWQAFTGYGKDTWQQYINDIPVGEPISKEPWKEYLMWGGAAGLSVFIVVAVAYRMWSTSKTKKREPDALSTALDMYVVHSLLESGEVPQLPEGQKAQIPEELGVSEADVLLEGLQWCQEMYPDEAKVVGKALAASGRFVQRRLARKNSSNTASHTRGEGGHE